jgi:hypothetical protein
VIKEFLKQKSCHKNDIKKFQKWLPNLLAYLSNVVNWPQHSLNMKLLKFHMMTHIASDILKMEYSKSIKQRYRGVQPQNAHAEIKENATATQSAGGTNWRAIC